MAPRTLPDRDYLLQCLDYDQETGVLTWRQRPVEHFPTEQAWLAWNGRWAGKHAGSQGRYRVIRIDWRGYYAHRLIWKMVTGQDPAAQIDHEKGNTQDNKWTSLREATNTENVSNQGKVRGRSELKGIYPLRNKWGAQIRIGKGKRIWLGVFATPEEAHAAYCRAAEEHHGRFANFGR